MVTGKCPVACLVVSMEFTLKAKNLLSVTCYLIFTASTAGKMLTEKWPPPFWFRSFFCFFFPLHYKMQILAQICLPWLHALLRQSLRTPGNGLSTLSGFLLLAVHFKNAVVCERIKIYTPKKNCMWSPSICSVELV